MMKSSAYFPHSAAREPVYRFHSPGTRLKDSFSERRKKSEADLKCSLRNTSYPTVGSQSPSASNVLRASQHLGPHLQTAKDHYSSERSLCHRKQTRQERRKEKKEKERKTKKKVRRKMNNDATM